MTDPPELSPPQRGSAAPPGRRFGLNVRLLMAQHGYKSITTMYKDLLAHGCTLSYSQFTRIVDNRAERLNVDVLNAMMSLFHCSAKDLVVDL